MENTLKLDKSNIGGFRWKCDVAHQNNQKTFTFNGQEVVTKFAKYVIGQIENNVK